MNIHEIRVGHIYTYQPAIGDRRRFRVTEVRRTIVYGELLDAPRGRCWFEESELHRLKPEETADA